MAGDDAGDFDDVPWYDDPRHAPGAAAQAVAPAVVLEAADPDRPPPERLLPDGRGIAFWNRVTELRDGKPVYVLRPDEMFVLEEACLGMDRIDEMDSDIAAVQRTRGDLYMTGSAGGTVANPLLSQRRGLSTQVTAMLKQLALPDATGGTATSGQDAYRAHQSAAGKARWSKRPATG